MIEQIKQPIQKNRIKTNLATFQNKWYRPGPPLKLALWYVVSFVIFQNALFPFYGLKRSLLRVFGAKVGEGVFIKPNVNIKYPWLLQLGNHIWIGEGVWIDNLGLTIIQDNVCLSQGCYLVTGNHNYKKAGFDLLINKIVLEDGVWIGAKAIVSPGVTCQSHSVLTLGSVATHNLDPYTIYQGNPAMKVKCREIETS